MIQNDVYDIFISYRRSGAEALAMLLHDRLTSDGYRVFLDVEALRSGDFNEALLDRIHACTDMLVILPPNALDRCVNEDDWVRREIECAIAAGKNIIPVMMRDFEFPTELPPSIATLPKYNGVTASSELFDGVMLRLKNKLLHSKPAVQASKADDKLMQMVHRFRYLMSTPMKYWNGDTRSEAQRLLHQMKTKYPDRPESYQCSLQYNNDVRSWDQMGTVASAFNEEPDWQYLSSIASPGLKAEMDAMLQASLDLRQKLADEAKEKKRLAAERAQARKAKKEEEARQLQEQERQQEELKKQQLLQNSLAAFDQLKERIYQLLKQPSDASQLEQLYQLQHELTAMPPEIDKQAVLADCQHRIDLLYQAAMKARHAAEPVLINYQNATSNAANAKCRKEHVKGEPVYQRKLNIPQGTVQVSPGAKLALLADGTIAALDKYMEKSPQYQTLRHWENIQKLFFAQDHPGMLIFGLQADGSVVACDIYGSECIIADWADIVSIVGYRQHFAALTKSGTVVPKLILDSSHPDTDGLYVSNPEPDGLMDEMHLASLSKWSNIAILYVIGTSIVGLTRDGSTVDSGSLDIINSAPFSHHWVNCNEIAGHIRNRLVAGLQSHGDVVFSNQYDQFTINEPEVCQIAIDGECNLLLLRADGQLLRYSYKHRSRTPLCQNALCIISDQLHGICLALLDNGCVAEIDLRTLERKTYACDMTVNAVMQGLDNWRQNAAWQLLTQRDKELSSPLLFGTRKEKLQRSVQRLEELLAKH